MKKIGIFYGSTTGNTEMVAKKIANSLGVPDSNVKEIGDLDKEESSLYEMIILGSSTWGDGEVQDDWYEAVDILKNLDLSGKTIALFGCGDSSSYSDTFCNAMGIIYEAIKGTGAKFIGQVSTDSYTYDESESVLNNKFIGLPIDEDNESDLTDGRIDSWIENLKLKLDIK